MSPSIITGWRSPGARLLMLERQRREHDRLKGLVSECRGVDQAFQLVAEILEFGVKAYEEADPDAYRDGTEDDCRYAEEIDLFQAEIAGLALSVFEAVEAAREKLTPEQKRYLADVRAELARHREEFNAAGRSLS